MSAFIVVKTSLRVIAVCFWFSSVTSWAASAESEHVCDAAKCGLQFSTSNSNSITTDAPLLRTDVEMDINGTALRTVVKQTFKNTGGQWVEGIYSFPLPNGAAVNELRMKIGQREIIGEIQERQLAEKTYQNAKQSGRKASLLKAHRPNLFTTKVANIGPFEEVVITIVYFKELPLSIEAQQVRFPMVIGPRYTPRGGSKHKELGSPVERTKSDFVALPNIPTVVSSPAEQNLLTININLNLGVPLAVIKSLYHQVDVEQQGTQYQIRLTKGSVIANRDFVLEFAPQHDMKPRAVLLSEQRHGFDYGLLMIMPPVSETIQSLPREVTFILDRSGSMSGTSIVQAKAAMKYALDQLKAGDKFNIVQFNSTSNSLFEQTMDFSPATLSKAKNFIQRLSATGGTEMLGALTLALGAEGSNAHVQQLIFITDGNVSNETALFNFIEENLGKRRLFTVGIGSAPNHYFLRHAAEAGSGFHLAIGDIGEVEERMTEMLNKIKTPLLTDITVSLENPHGETLNQTSIKPEEEVNEIEIWPRVIPDLYVGEPIAIAIRSRKPGVKLRIDGKLPDYHWHTVATLSGGQRRGGLAELWGQRKIHSLMADHRRARNDEVVQLQLREQIIHTALSSHLVSKFTSLVAVEKQPSNPNQYPNKTKSIPRHLPHGWSKQSWVTSLPRTGTNTKQRLGVGIFLITMFAVSAWYFQSRRGVS